MVNLFAMAEIKPFLYMRKSLCACPFSFEAPEKVNDPVISADTISKGNKVFEKL